MKFNLYKLDNEYKISKVKTIEVKSEDEAYFYIVTGQVDYYEVVKNV